MSGRVRGAARLRQRLSAVLLLALAARCGAQTDASATDGAAAGVGSGGGSSDGDAPSGQSATDAAAAVASGAAATGSASPATGSALGAPPASAGAAPYVWRGAAASALSPHAPPSWMTKTWPPHPPYPPPWPPNSPRAHPPPSPPPKDLAFLALADWGGQTDWPMTTVAQLQCAGAMAAVSKQLQVTHVLAAGDNFYDGGITGAADSQSALGRWNSTWSSVYQGTYPELEIPWYLVAGNHDWEGNVSAEVAATATQALWNMPALYYTFSLSLPESSQTVQFVMLDTESLAGGDAGQFDSAPPGILQPPVDETQWSWVTTTLSSSTADWLIVVGHFPVYSVGENGPTPLLVTRLLPLLESAGVALYICGHDHQLAHIGPATGSVVDFIVTGAGAKFNSSEAHAAEVPAETLKFQYGVGCGFASVHVQRQGFTPSSLTVTLWDGSGAVLYSFTKPNPRAKYMPPAPPKPPGPPSPFDTHSNKVAVMVGLVGMVAGLGAICGGVGRGGDGRGGEPGGSGGSGPPGIGLAPVARPGQAVRAAAPKPAAASLERGEKAALLLQQRTGVSGYGGIASARNVNNRL